jgi:hypothetical protein
MPIHIPTLMEPFQGTDEQWAAYFKQQSAGLDYVIAYGNTIGIFALFSRKKNRLLKQARDRYHEARDAYSKSVGVR